ncbi:hypothetical protein D3C73_1299010 [compost metagenome]
MPERPERAHRGMAAHFHFVAGHEKAQPAQVVLAHGRHDEGRLMAVVGRQCLHIAGSHLLRIQYQRYGVPAIHGLCRVYEYAQQNRFASGRLGGRADGLKVSQTGLRLR